MTFILSWEELFDFPLISVSVLCYQPPKHIYFHLAIIFKSVIPKILLQRKKRIKEHDDVIKIKAGYLLTKLYVTRSHLLVLIYYAKGALSPLRSRRLESVHLESKFCRLRLKRDDTRAETRFRLSAKRTSPFKSAGASVQ